MAARRRTSRQPAPRDRDRRDEGQTKYSCTYVLTYVRTQHQHVRHQRQSKHQNSRRPRDFKGNKHQRVITGANNEATNTSFLSASLRTDACGALRQWFRPSRAVSIYMYMYPNLQTRSFDSDSDISTRIIVSIYVYPNLQTRSFDSDISTRIMVSVCLGVWPRIL